MPLLSRQIVLRAALDTLREAGGSARLNAIEVGCMFKGDEGQSTLEIARCLLRERAGGCFVSIEKDPSHIEACRAQLHAESPELLEAVQFLEGPSSERMPQALAMVGELDLAFLDGGAGPIDNLSEFERAARSLAPHGLILVDDLQEMAPTPAFPHPRPYGKGTLIVPFLVIHEFLRTIGAKSGPAGVLASTGRPALHSRLCEEVLAAFGSLEHRIVRCGAHAMLLAGRSDVVLQAHSRAEAGLGQHATEAAAAH